MASKLTPPDVKVLLEEAECRDQQDYNNQFYDIQLTHTHPDIALSGALNKIEKNKN